MTDLPEHVLRNREAWDRSPPSTPSAGQRSGPATSRLGHLGRARVRARRAARRPRRPGRDRARLRHRLRVGLARPPRRAAGRHRQLAGPARDRPGAPARVRARVPAATSATPSTSPFPDASFDLAISEYGASIWCDPYRWIPEAARLLRPGGQLIFLVNGTLHMLCTPDLGDREIELLSGNGVSLGVADVQWELDPNSCW